MTTSKSLDKITILKLALTIGIPILLLLIPTNDVFTSQMRMAIAATALLLIWAACDLTDLAVPSILWSAILVFTQTVDAATLYSSYVSMTFYGAISMMIFASVMARIGVLKRLAFWIAAKAGGTFGKINIWRFLCGICDRCCNLYWRCYHRSCICIWHLRSSRLHRKKRRRYLDNGWYSWYRDSAYVLDLSYHYWCDADRCSIC